MKKTPQCELAIENRQAGAILVFCLVFLTILTMMSVSAMQSTVLEERMAGNMQDYTMAFQAAESALKNAEAWLVAQAVLPGVSGDGSTLVWSADAIDPVANDGRYWWDHADIDAHWWSANAKAITGVADVAAQPQFVIEQYRTVTTGQSIGIGEGKNTFPRVFYRITARGVGGSFTTAVLLQSTFVKSYH